MAFRSTAKDQIEAQKTFADVLRLLGDSQFTKMGVPVFFNRGSRLFIVQNVFIKYIYSFLLKLVHLLYCVTS